MRSILALGRKWNVCGIGILTCIYGRVKAIIILLIYLKGAATKVAIDLLRAQEYTDQKSRFCGDGSIKVQGHAV